MREISILSTEVQPQFFSLTPCPTHNFRVCLLYSYHPFSCCPGCSLGLRFVFYFPNFSWLPLRRQLPAPLHRRCRCSYKTTGWRLPLKVAKAWKISVRFCFVYVVGFFKNLDDVVFCMNAVQTTESVTLLFWALLEGHVCKKQLWVTWNTFLLRCWTRCRTSSQIRTSDKQIVIINVSLSQTLHTNIKGLFLRNIHDHECLDCNLVCVTTIACVPFPGWLREPSPPSIFVDIVDSHQPVLPSGDIVLNFCNLDFPGILLTLLI